ncbi:MAG: trigger factor [Bacteroidales bacterium]
MNISRENVGELGAYLKLELVPADYGDKVKKELKNYQHKAQIKGFRQGQVPPSLIQKMYGKTILIEEINKLVSENLSKYIEEQKLAVLGQPIPAPSKERESKINFDTPNDFVFWFEIGLAPEFKIELEKIKAIDYHIQITDEMIDKYAESICRRFGNVSSPDKVGETDVLGGEIFELNENGEIKDGGLQTKTSISVDLISLKTIQKKFISKPIGDTIDFALTKAFKSSADIATMFHISEEEAKHITAEFRFRIDSITHVDPAELNEELFKKVYPKANIKDVEEFCEEIRKESAKYYAKDTEKKTVTDIIEEILVQTNIQLPDEFLKRWIVYGDEKKTLTPEIVEQEYPQYVKSLKWQLIEDKLIKEYNIEAKAEDVKAFYKENILSQYFSNNAEDEETNKRMDMVVDSMMQNQEEVKKIYDMLFEQKISEVLKSKVNLNIKEITMDDFIALLKADSEKK